MADLSNNFESLTQGMVTKSDKIRALGRVGASTGEIARFLGIRYQFARNVLVDAGLRGIKSAAPASKKQNIQLDTVPSTGDNHAWVEIGKGGEVVLPPQMLASAGLSAGERAFVQVGGNGLEVLSRRAALERAQDIVSKYVPPGASVVDDFIAERRSEAAREDSHAAGAPPK